MADSRRGTVAAIHVAPERGAPMESRADVTAVADRGLEGDRYFEQAGSWSGSRGRNLSHAERAVTLFEVETLDLVKRDHGIELDPADHRRNVTTRGIELDHLIDRRFRVGEAVFEGVDRCEPCAYLESLTEEGVLEALIHRGGLNAAIVDGGSIAVGDPIVVE